MDEAILDASAVLALIQREPGWGQVQAVSSRLISTVNLAEVGSVLAKNGYDSAGLEVTFAALRLKTVDFDRIQALEVARLRPLTQSYGLSLGDRACLALAGLRGLPVVTAERTWDQAAPHVSIIRIR